MQTRFFCFTRHLNHGSLETSEVELVLKPLCSYYVFQTEVCPDTHREHLQGYVVLEKKCRNTTFARKFPCHVESRKGTHTEASAYCKKEASRKVGTQFTEYGEYVTSAGGRTDLADFRDAILSGSTNWELIEYFPAQVAKYPRFVQLVRNEKLQRTVLQELPVFQPQLGWQFTLSQQLEAPPNSRIVIWRWDSTGNVGKSYFALTYKPLESYIVTGGKHADIHYSYGFQKYVFFDWPRSNQESFPYGLVEQFKNGYFLSTKYESVGKRFHVPHVVVFANFAPDISQMSLDRWNIMDISQ